MICQRMWRRNRSTSTRCSSARLRYRCMSSYPFPEEQARTASRSEPRRRSPADSCKPIHRREETSTHFSEHVRLPPMQYALPFDRQSSTARSSRDTQRSLCLLGCDSLRVASLQQACVVTCLMQRVAEAEDSSSNRVSERRPSTQLEARELEECCGREASCNDSRRAPLQQPSCSSLPSHSSHSRSHYITHTAKSTHCFSTPCPCYNTRASSSTHPAPAFVPDASSKRAHQMQRSLCTPVPRSWRAKAGLEMRSTSSLCGRVVAM